MDQGSEGLHRKEDNITIEAGIPTVDNDEH